MIDCHKSCSNDGVKVEVCFADVDGSGEVDASVGVGKQWSERVCVCGDYAKHVEGKAGEVGGERGIIAKEDHRRQIVGYIGLISPCKKSGAVGGIDSYGKIKVFGSGSHPPGYIEDEGGVGDINFISGTLKLNKSN